MQEPRIAPSPLIFVHIPKTGGRTLEDILRRVYLPTGAKHFEFEGGRECHDRFIRIPLHLRDEFDLLDGHCHYGLHRRLSRPATYLTVLREPVDRVLSLYYYIHQCGGLHYMYEQVVKGGVTLHEYVEMLLSVEVDNGQVRALNPEMLWDVPNGQVRRPMLEDAKRNLEHGFASFGLTERFDESLILFQRALGWRDMDLRYRRQNVTASRPKPAEVERRTLDLIREINQYDIELYEFAVDLFAERVRLQGPRFSDEVTRFCEANSRFTAASVAV
ncbi:MAG: sulfotransferase family 2 domain-containing protein [Phycisphaerales bacterium JB039]